MTTRYGINPLTGRCRQCGKRQVRFETLGTGHAVEVAAPCPCPKTPPPAPPKPKRAWATAVDVERRRAGICQRCDEPTVGKPRVALYCEAHRKEARAEAQRKMRAKVGGRYTRAYAERNREKLAAKARAYYQGDPAVREHRNAYKRLWRKLNRQKVRAQKERAALKHFRELPEWQRHYREDIRAGKRKPKRARTNKNGERLCVTPYCRSVMTGRAKKCLKCKVKEIRAARQALSGVRQRRAA